MDTDKATTGRLLSGEFWASAWLLSPLQEQLKRSDFVHGQFGENFTIEGFHDAAVCIGDCFQIGSGV